MKKFIILLAFSSWVIQFAQAQFIFAPRVDYPTSAATAIIETADINGDNIPDLAVPHAGILSIYLGSGFGSFSPSQDISLSTLVVGFVIRDFDGDTKLDIAAANHAAGNVSILIGDGAGTFAPPVNYPVGFGLQRMVSGDFNGDTFSDLAVTGFSNSVSILLGTGTGTFNTAVNYAVGIFPIELTMNDFNADGNLDLAVANFNGFNVSVLTGSGSGTFSTSQTLATGGNSSHISSADFNSDGVIDLVVSSSSNRFSFYAGSGTGTFSSPQHVVIGGPNGPGAHRAKDFNADGKLDLAVGNGNNNTIGIYHGDGAGAFVLTQSIPVGGFPNYFLISDFNGDALIDIASSSLTSNNFGVLLGVTPPTVTSFLPSSGPIGTTVTITGTNFDPTPANNIVYFGAVRAIVATASATELTLTVPVGATYQPISVLVRELTAYSSAPFVVTFPGGGTVDACSFAPNVSFTTGTSARDVAFGDLDGDGKSDLVVTNNNSSSVSVFLNTSSSGSITSGSFAAKVDFATGAFATSVAIGDLDGDGKKDLAITNFNSNSVSIFRNTSSPGSITSGSFAPKVDFTTGTSPNEVAISDVDGDGKPDLAVANYGSNTVSVFLNTGSSGSITTGSFAAKVDFTVGTSARDVAFGDLDGDGKPDLVAANRLSNSVSVLRNTSVPGSITSGSFAAIVDFATGTEPVELAIGDLDMDGKQDLVVTNFSSNSLSVFRNLSSVGSISLGAKVDFTTGTNPHDIQINDLDGDGKPDLAVSNRSSSNISAFRNTSTPGSITSGSFAAKVDFTTGTLPTGLATGDLDGDNKPDLVATNHGSNEMWVLRNTMGEFPIPTITSFTPSSGPIGTSITITGTNFDLIPTNNDVKFNGTAAVVTASTATSITTSVPVGTIAGTITVLVGCNTATSSANFTVTPPLTITSFSPTSGPIGTTVIITGTNFSTTPASNIVYFGATRAAVTVATATQLTVTVPTGATYRPITVQVAGLTAFSSNPFLVTFSGGGTIDACSFAPKVDFIAGTTPLSTYIGDLDGDGKADLVTANQNANTISVFRNTSTLGTIGAASFAVGVNFPVAIQPYLIIIGDVDGDGKPDLVTSNEGNATVSVLRNTSVVGTLDAASFAARVDFTTGAGPHSVSLGDLDADGRPELVTANFNTNTLSILKNNCVIGVINASSFAAKVDFVTGTNPQSVGIADLDADGKPDLAVTNGNTGTNTLSVLRNTANPGIIDGSSFAARVDFTTGFFPRSLAIGDIDGDGKLDLVTANFTSSTISVLQNTSSVGTITSGSFATKVDFVTAANPHGVTIDDLDGDGKPDIAVANGGSASIGLFKNLSSSGAITVGSFASRVDFSTGIGPTNIAIGDLEGDGKPEIVVGVGGSNVVSVFHNRIGVPPPIPVSAVGGNSCGPGSVTLSVSGAAPGQYRWYTTPTGGTPIPAETNDSYTTGVISATTTYYTTLVINACESFTRTPVTATINSFPTAPSSVGGNRCGPGSVVVSVSGGAAGQYRWYTVPSGGSALAGETVATYTTPVLAATTPYYAAIHDGTCENPSRTTVNAVINSIPSDPAPPVVNGPFCSGSTFDFSTSGASPGEYLWYTGSSGGTPIPGATNGTYSLVLTSTSIATYHASIVINGCESGRQQSMAASVTPLPTAPMAPNPPPVCPTYPTTLTASGTTDGNFRWYESGILMPAEVNSILLIASLSITKIFQVSIDNGTCESLKTSVTSAVQPCTPPGIADNVSAPFIPGIIRIDLSELLTDAEGNLDLSTLVIVGTLLSGATATIVGTELVIDYTGIAFPGIESIELYVCDLTGKCTQETLAINLSSEIKIFNAMSPNGDDMNQTFFIENINMLPDTKENRVKIFNRWGDVVFEVENYDNVNKVFLGLNNKGESVPAGTYFYRIDFKSGVASKTGFISLKK